ncbi:helix-turn-helix domain-containing protein [Allofournierella sp.]|uniref:helix-turn-helix domain-containing protein n=1 Tax=Allofournierella sp. TaxID=1940256 RepID=UPI003AB50B6A
MSISVAFMNAVTSQREALGLTQAQLAEMCEMSERGYQKVEYGEVIPNLETVGRIANALEISLDALMEQTYGKRPAAVG